MARAAGLSGSGLNLFGGGGTSFGAFNLTGVTSAAEQAALAYSVLRAKHDAGLVSDADFETQQAAYLNGLDKTTSAGATAAWTISMQKYTDDRNSLQQAVQNGTKTYDDLAAFDRKSMEGLDPGSTEYQQRQDRLYSSEQGVFQTAEKTVIDNLSHGRITNAQAQEWYRQQGIAYAGNPAVREDVKSKVSTLQDRIVADQDQQMSKDWNDGKVTIQQVIAYASSGIASDPTSQRAKDLGDFMKNAKDTAVEASLNARYKLTRELHDLEAFVAGASSPAGHTTTSHQTRTVLGADGKWHTTTVAVNTYHAPSAAAQQAWKEQQAQVKEAKDRISQIKAEVGATPGGWVTEDDLIRHLSQMQAGVERGTKLWFDYQDQIDGLNQRKAQDRVLAAKGIHIAYPPVKSENTKDVTVGDFERPVPGGKTTVSPTSTVGGGSGGGSGGSRTSSPAAANALATTAKGTTQNGGGPLSDAFQRITGAGYTPTRRVGNTLVVQTKTGIPANMDPRSFETFHTEFINAIKNGQASFFDKVTGANYAIPLDADKRLTMLRTLDQTWVAMKQEAVNKELATGKHTSATIAYLQGQYAGAVQKANDNLWYILDAASPGSVATVNPKTGEVESIDNATRASTVTRDQNGKVISTQVGVTGTVKGPTNALGYASEILDAAKNFADQQNRLAQDAFDRGDYQQALLFINEIGQNNTRVQTRLYGQDGTGGIVGKLNETVTKAGLTAPTGDIGKDWDRVQGGNNELATLLDGTKDIRTQLLGSDGAGGGILQMQNGQIVSDAAGNPKLKPGYVREMNESGKVTVTKLPVTGFDDNRQPIYSDPTGKKVIANIKSGNTFVPVSVTAKIGKVGTVTDANGNRHDVYGKIAEDPTGKNGAWASSPFQPGVWVPGGSDFTAPKDLQITTANMTGTTAGLPGVQKGDEVWSWTYGGQQFTAVPDKATGTFAVYRAPQQQGGLAGLLSSGPFGGQQAPQQVQLVDSNGLPTQESKWLTDSGFGYDQSRMDADQRAAYTTQTKYGDALGVGGAFIGATADDYSRMFGKAEQAIDMRNNALSFGAWAQQLIASARANIANAAQQGSNILPPPGGFTGTPAGQAGGWVGAVNPDGSLNSLGQPQGAGTPAWDHGSAQVGNAPPDYTVIAAKIAAANPLTTAQAATQYSATGHAAPKPAPDYTSVLAKVAAATPAKTAAAATQYSATGHRTTTTTTSKPPVVTPPPVKAPAPLPGKTNTTRL